MVLVADVHSYNVLSFKIFESSNLIKENLYDDLLKDLAVKCVKLCHERYF